MPESSRVFEKTRPLLFTALQSYARSEVLSQQQRQRISQCLENGLSAETFSKLPTMHKKDLFHTAESISRILCKSPTQPLRLIPSAGSTGENMAFRIHQAAATASQYQAIFRNVTEIWNIDPTADLIINAYPAMLNLPDNIHSIECGPRPELIGACIKNILPSFGKGVLLCQPHLLRYLGETGILSKDTLLNLFFIIGGSWSPRSFAADLSRLLGIRPENISPKIISLYGLAEAGLGVGMHTPTAARQREHSNNDDGMPFTLDDSRFLMESLNGKLFLTTLNPTLHLPLIRYETGDFGGVTIDSDGRIIFSVRGRVRNSIDTPSAEQIEELLSSSPYSDIWSGQFRMTDQSLIIGIRNNRKSEPLIHSVAQQLASFSIEAVPQAQFPDSRYRDFLRKPRPQE